MLLILWLAIASVPMLIIMDSSTFAPEAAGAGASSPQGVSMVGTQGSLFGLTMAAILDDSVDNGTLPWMQYQFAGTGKVFSMRKSTFLMCEYRQGVTNDARLTHGCLAKPAAYTGLHQTRGNENYESPYLPFRGLCCHVPLQGLPLWMR